MPDTCPRRSPLVIVLVASLGGGCVIPMPVGNGVSDEGSSGDFPDGSASASMTSTGGGTAQSGDAGPSSADGPESTDGSGATTADDGGAMILPLPDTNLFDPCDIWAQRCDPGFKCVPWSNDGGPVWNATRCIPVVGEPDVVGEPCTVEGFPASGADSCDLGAICWGVDPETLEGTCVAQCTGSPEAPMCPGADTTCVIANEDLLAICLPTCDPLLPECAEDEVCFPVDDTTFVCMPEGSGGIGGPGQSCENIATCDPGLVCVQPQYVPDCASGDCCTAFCDLTDPVPPCLPGQGCTPWFEGVPPAGYEDVGFCALPA